MHDDPRTAHFLHFFRPAAYHDIPLAIGAGGSLPLSPRNEHIFTNLQTTIHGDGRPLGSAIIGGADPAHRFDCDLAGVMQLQLTLTARGGDSKSNYPIWAEPALLKKP